MPGILIKEVEYRGAVGDLLVTAHGVVPLGDYDHVIDGHGLVAVPAFADHHVHFRDPGQTEKEDIQSGARAAAAGGYAFIRCEPNTRPAIDTIEAVLTFFSRVWGLDLPVTILPKCALTIGQQGKELVDIEEISARVPWIRFSSDGEPMSNRELLLSAIQATRGQAFIDLHCEETPGSATRVTRDLGFGPPLAREAELIRLALSVLEEAGYGKLHFQHVSQGESVALIADAKRRGLTVTAEVTPHHLLLTPEDIPQRDGGLNANWKMNPPLRGREDMLAVQRGLAEGTIDYLATDHAPHTREEKARPWDEAPFGVIGLETAFGAAMTLVHAGELTFARLIEAMAPSTDGGELPNITVVDPNTEWTVDPDRFYSKSRNCPFAGMTFKGKPVYTIAGGKLVMAEGEVLF
jgi:dihydroorotase